MIQESKIFLLIQPTNQLHLMISIVEIKKCLLIKEINLKIDICLKFSEKNKDQNLRNLNQEKDLLKMSKLQKQIS